MPQLLDLTGYHRKGGKGSINTLSSLISNLFTNGKLLFLYLFLPWPRLVLSRAGSPDDLELRSGRCRKLEIGSTPTLISHRVLNVDLRARNTYVYVTALPFTSGGTLSSVFLPGNGGQFRTSLVELPGGLNKIHAYRALGQGTGA